MKTAEQILDLAKDIIQFREHGITGAQLGRDAPVTLAADAALAHAAKVLDDDTGGGR